MTTNTIRHIFTKYNGKEAGILINTVSLRFSSLPNRILGLVVKWVQLHQQELLDHWKRARKKEPLLTILGLDQ